MKLPFVTLKKYADLALFCLRLQGEIDRLKEDHQRELQEFRQANIMETQLREFYQRKADRLEAGLNHPRAKNGRFALKATKPIRVHTSIGNQIRAHNTARRIAVSNQHLSVLLGIN